MILFSYTLAHRWKQLFTLAKVIHKICIVIFLCTVDTNYYDFGYRWLRFGGNNANEEILDIFLVIKKATFVEECI